MTSMHDRITELNNRRETAASMGGKEKIERQHGKEKLTARERIDLLLDPGSFQEYGLLATHMGQKPGEKITPADGIVAGVGRIDGRPVGLYAEDATVLGGTTGEINLLKRIRIIEIVGRERVPFICLLDGAGFRAQAMMERPEGVPFAAHFHALARQSGIAPTMALVLGPCAGEPALEAALVGYSIMVEGTGMVAAGGPPVVKASIGIDVSKEQLGGTSVHAEITGMIDNTAGNDEEAIANARRFLSYLPVNAWSYPPSVSAKDPKTGSQERILSILPDSLRRAYDMRDVIDCLIDEDSFYEIKPDYGRALIVGLARLNGHSIGLIANQPTVCAGAIAAAEGQKVRKFIDLCGAYHIPLVSLTDTPGVMTGPQAEREGSLKFGLAAIYAAAWANVPVFTVILRKAFGYGGALMAGYNSGQTLSLAWPTVDFSSMPADSAIDSAHAQELEQAEDREALYKELMEKYSAYSGPLPAAGMMNIDDVIDPRETRAKLIQALELSMARRTEAPSPTIRKGVMP